MVAILSQQIALLAALLHIFFGIIMAIGCVGILGVLYFKENQKNKRNFCASCGARIDYENGVAWEVTNYEEKDFTPNENASGKQIISKSNISHDKKAISPIFGRYCLLLIRRRVSWSSYSQ